MNKILYINFESLKYDFIKNAKDLFNYVESLKTNNEKYYVFLDEIQKVEEFESNEKYIITMDRNSYSVEGVKILNIFDFLMDDGF